MREKTLKNMQLSSPRSPGLFNANTFTKTQFYQSSVLSIMYNKLRYV